MNDQHKFFKYIAISSGFLGLVLNYIFEVITFNSGIRVLDYILEYIIVFPISAACGLIIGYFISFLLVYLLKKDARRSNAINQIKEQGKLLDIIEKDKNDN